MSTKRARGAPAVATTISATGCRCTMSGEIDFSNLEEFRAKLTSALHIGEPVVVDLRAVTFFSLSATRVLLKVHDLADVLQCPMQVLGSPCVNRVLHLSGADTELTLPHQHSQRFRY
ncbi:STAS domain-containing protein [Nocardia acididurans]|nr:STAS domain-containing protein [Nocardia acididurans]